MGEKTLIEWADGTFNPWWGCWKISPGCENCYADSLDHRLGGEHWGRTATRKFQSDKYWRQPELWNERAARDGEPRRIFCASMCDVFEAHPMLDTAARMNAERWRLWSLIERTPSLIWMLLTKRPANIIDMVPPRWLVSGMPNVWIGVTAEDQRRADERIPELLRHDWAAVRFVSYEPALGPIDIGNYLYPLRRGDILSEGQECLVNRPPIDWVIAGAESGSSRREMDDDWVRSARDQCATAGANFFFKQKIEGRRKVALPILDGRRWSMVPEVCNG